MPFVPAKIRIGIDPGKGGGIVVLVGEGEVHYSKMPQTEADIVEYLTNQAWRDNTNTKAVIEKVHSMPGQGVKSMFTFGQNYGTLRGILAAIKIPFDEVTPRHWQKALNIPPRKKTETPTQWKNRLKQKAQQLFPELTVTLAVSDALLIAHYCKQHWS
jgi:hypothetical protein